MAAVFRTLVSSQEPIYTPPPRPFWKKDSPASRADSKMENEEHTTSSPGTPSGKKLNIFRRRKNRKNMLQQSAAHDTTTTPALDATSPTTNSSGFAVTRAPSPDAPIYSNRAISAMEPREPLQRSDRRESYVQDLRALARTAPSPEYEAPKRLGNNNNNIMSPKSFFEDDSSDEEEGLGRRLKRSFSSMKAHGGGSGGGGTADGSSIGLGIGEMEQERQSPVISSPTNFRRLNSAHDMAQFSLGSKGNRRLGKSPSTSSLGDLFRGKAAETSPTPQRPSDAGESGDANLRSKTPADLARAQRRQQAALPSIAERPAAPALQPWNAAEGNDEAGAASDSSSFYLDDAVADALPPPLRIVKRGQQQHLRARRAADGKITRTPSFLRRVEEIGEQRRQQLQSSRSHPALRDQGFDASTVVRSSCGPVSSEMLQQRMVREDVPPVPALPATAPLPQGGFDPHRPSLERAIQDFFSPNDPNLTPGRTQGNALVGNAFVQQLRRDYYGLEPFIIAKEGDMKHPKHPLKWDTETLVCAGKHDVADLPKLSGEETSTTTTAAASASTSWSTVSSFTSAADPTPDTRLIAAARSCALCGRYCCHFINLLAYLNSSPGNTSLRYADIQDEQQRILASARVMRLKQEWPNGLDVYDTFVTCGVCGKEVCAGCAGRCEEAMCGDVVCNGCGGCGHEV